jgi:2-aminoethylphosphonate-pyruvate transaminase
MSDRDKSIQGLADSRNEAKLLFTAGPASLLPENLTGLRPCFGRGDRDYANVESAVLDALRAMSGHAHIARMQGSASLALEIMALNFLRGRVLVVDTGYYAERLRWLADACLRRGGEVRSVDSVAWTDLDHVAGGYDWVWACPTETSCGLRLPIAELSAAARRLGARLMLDATASIGLEDGHELADVIAYSSCKGLFGLTGACFIAFNDAPAHAVDSFYLNLATHLERRMTGPYHAIASLADVLPRHADFRAAVAVNKARFVREMADWLSLPPERQPLLCTHVTGRVTSNDPRAVLYAPRSNLGGSVVCHLGEAHLGRAARGDILGALAIE